MKYLIFAGTYEGRLLSEFINENGLNADVCVATEYGENLISQLKNINVLNGRLDQVQIENLIETNNYLSVIDATHPYATVVTGNIKQACLNKNTKYIRLLRTSSLDTDSSLIEVSDIYEAVDFLNQNNDNILVTTGSKELYKYKGLNNLKSRLFARVLPSIESIELCLNISLSGKNIICMQGPFTKALNVAMLNQFNCKYLVTKDTGNIGGLNEKIDAAKETGANVILIKRPCVEQGYSLNEVKKIIIGN